MPRRKGMKLTPSLLFDGMKKKVVNLAYALLLTIKYHLILVVANYQLIHSRGDTL